MNEQVVEVNVNGVQYKVYVGKITYGQRTEILQKCMRSKIVGRGIDVTIDFALAAKMITVKSIKRVEPEIKMSVEEWLNTMEADEAVKIEKVALEMNPLQI